jgi:hypothetical protein
MARLPRAKGQSRFCAGGGEIVLNDPQLPNSIREISMRNVRLGSGSADFTLAREGTKVRLAETSGHLAVSLAAKLTY